MAVYKKELFKAVKFAAPGVTDQDADAICEELIQTFDIFDREPEVKETVEQAAKRGYNKGRG